jgi:hypothetical protein
MASGPARGRGIASGFSAAAGPLLVGLGLLAFAVAIVVQARTRRLTADGALVAIRRDLRWESPTGADWRPRINEAQATFEVVNRGDRPVRITETKTSCGCARPTIRPSEALGAGESGFVFLSASKLLSLPLRLTPRSRPKYNCD